jgi:hypothetical protein
VQRRWLQEAGTNAVYLAGVWVGRGAGGCIDTAATDDNGGTSCRCVDNN